MSCMRRLRKLYRASNHLDDPRRLKGWLVRVAVFTARGVIRRRQRRRWLGYRPPESMPESARSDTPPEMRGRRCGG